MPFTIPNEITYQSEITSAEHEQNYLAIEDDLNTEVVRRDGSVAMTGQLLLSGAPVAGTGAATKDYVDGLIPLGIAFPFFGLTAPANHTFPIGQSLARATYPLVAQMIAPDNTSPYWIDANNFRLPNLADRMPLGKGGTFPTLDAKSGSKDAVAVEHSHTMTDHSHNYSGSSATGGSSQDMVRRLAAGGGGFWTGADDDGDGLMNTVPFGTGGWAQIYTGMHVDYTTTHTHGFSWSGTTTGANSGVGNSTASQSPSSSGTNANMPPYIVCNWIMRLA